MKVGVSFLKSGALIATMTAVGAFLVFTANGSPTEMANPVVATVPPSPFSTGLGPSELIADVSALMIVVDGRVQPDELAFAQSLAENPQLLISGQGMWPVDQQMVSVFSKDKYQQQLNADLASFKQESNGLIWTAHKMSEAASDILNSSRSLGPEESTVTLVSAAASVWSKQVFEQASLEETHENAKQRERLNLHF